MEPEPVQRTAHLAVVALVAAACTASPPATAPTASTATSAERLATVRPAPSPTPEPTPGTVVMWARGGLPVEVATSAARLPGVIAAVHVRSDTLGLVGSRDADGRPVDVVEPGWRIPVEVSAVDPASAGVLPAGPTRDAVAALRPGEVLLPASSASRRGVDVGGAIDLRGAAGLVVAAIVEDEVLGRAEVVVHTADADRVGLEPDGSLRVLHDRPDGASLADELEALAPEDVTVRVVGADTGQPARRAPLVLGLPEVKSRFGEFAYRDDDADREITPSAAWVEEHIVVAEVPLIGRVRCHEAIVDDLRGALQAVADSGHGASMTRDSYAGCYHARRIGAGSSLSRHSWGIAIDLNVDVSQPGLGPVPDDAVIEAFAAHGFRWGGLFLRPDNHHFEWVGEAARQDPPGPRGDDTSAAMPDGTR